VAAHLSFPPFFFFIVRPAPLSTLFPYTTLFRSDHVLSFGAGSGPTGRVRRPSRASDRSWRRPLPVTGTRGQDLRGRGATAYSVSRVRQCCTRRAHVPEPAVPGGAGTPQGRCGARR